MLKAKKLDFIPTPELIDEVLGRFHSAVFIGLKPEQYAPNNYWYEIKGCRLTCSGLVQELGNLIEDSRREHLSKTEDKSSD